LLDGELPLQESAGVAFLRGVKSREA
jgi:hypothetical protein